MCLRGCDTSLPPACCTNSAGENKLPWHTQMMLTSDFVYLYRKPFMVLPSGPLPVVETQGMVRRETMPSWIGGAGGLGGFPISPLLVSLVELMVLISGLGGAFLRFNEVDSTDGVFSMPPLLHLSMLWAESFWWEVQLCSDLPFWLLPAEQFIWVCSAGWQGLVLVPDSLLRPPK